MNFIRWLDHILCSPEYDAIWGLIGGFAAFFTLCFIAWLLT